MDAAAVASAGDPTAFREEWGLGDAPGLLADRTAAARFGECGRRTVRREFTVDGQVES